SAPGSTSGGCISRIDPGCRRSPHRDRDSRWRRGIGIGAPELVMWWVKAPGMYLGSDAEISLFSSWIPCIVPVLIRFCPPISIPKQDSLSVAEMSLLGVDLRPSLIFSAKNEVFCESS
ncbi:hypothetical protein BHE74_00035858, partial [Ensete ventricosum]